MALTKMLTDAGHTPERIRTEASVDLSKKDGGFAIGEITLKTTARIPDFDQSQFKQLAEKAKDNCPVSKALSGTNIKLEATLEQ